MDTLSEITSLVGTWCFIRSSKPDADLRTIYHFTSDGLNYWEAEEPGETGRRLFKMQYELQENILTLIYSAGSKKDFILTLETDGSIRFPGADGFDWWMKRLEYPKSDSKAFVDSSGLLKRLENTESS